MNMCPACGYSTFTDETFPSCPACGATGSNRLRRLPRVPKKDSRRSGINAQITEKRFTEPAPEGKIRKYTEMLDLTGGIACDHPSAEQDPAPTLRISNPMKLTGWVAAGGGTLLICAAMSGLFSYYVKDWQSILSVPLLEPVSRLEIFFKAGLFPWLRFILGICFIGASYHLLTEGRHAAQILSILSHGIIVFNLLEETVVLANRIALTSGAPSSIFYIDRFVTFIVTVFFWSSPFLAVILLLRYDRAARRRREKMPRTRLSRT